MTQDEMNLVELGALIPTPTKNRGWIVSSADSSNGDPRCVVVLIDTRVPFNDNPPMVKGGRNTLEEALADAVEKADALP